MRIIRLQVSVAADCCCCCCCDARLSATSTPVSAADYDDGDDKYQTTDNDDRRDDNEESVCCTGDVFDTVHVSWLWRSTNVHLTPHCCIKFTLSGLYQTTASRYLQCYRCYKVLVSSYLYIVYRFNLYFSLSV